MVGVLMNTWTLFCPRCGGPKSQLAKACSDCNSIVPRRLKRKRNSVAKTHAIPTEVTLSDGTVLTTRSKLEASWLIALESCSPCYECLEIPIPQKGRRGTFIGNYTPDLIIGDVYVELKSSAKAAKKDTRSIRALTLNPEAKFLVIGGYPRSLLYVKMVSSEGVREFSKIKLGDVRMLLGCP